jgi:molybdate transport system substrate-binding protein
VRRLLVGACLVALISTACGGTAAGGSGTGEPTRELTVLAAASLTEAFDQIGAGFSQSHPGVTVTFSFGPSDGLATQIREGAPADVFASASPSWMDAVAKDPGVTGRADFARNRLMVIVPSGNPADITSVQDLARPGVKLVLAAEGVPAGDYARQILQNAGIGASALANVVSNEEDVKGVVTKVISGDADAGIVYVTDVTSQVRPRLEEVRIPDEINVTATYPIAIVDGTAEEKDAKAFVAYVLGPGQNVLRSFGFLPAG